MAIKKIKKTAVCSMTVAAAITVAAFPAYGAQSAPVTSVLPSAGISYVIASESVSLVSLQKEQNEKKEAEESAKASRGRSVVSVVTGSLIKKETIDADNAGDTADTAASADASASGTADETVQEIVETIASPVTETGNGAIEIVETVNTAGIVQVIDEAEQSVTVTDEGVVNVEVVGEEAKDDNDETEFFRSLVIAQVNDYVNVREEASTESEVVGKLYDDSVGELIETDGEWYKIKSGNVTGYVKSEYCVTGDDAIALAPEVGTRIATVDTTTLKVRAEAGTETEVIGLVPIGDELVVKEELEGWVRVEIEEGEGYVSSDYVLLSTEFVKAESKAEEEARLARERAEREAAERAAAAAAAAAAPRSSGSSAAVAAAPVATGGGSATGQAVANYACQFVGNPYVYGGTSLTNGADCSGFVMSVYAHFGVSLPHSSAADRGVGRAVQGGLAGAQPGDIVCYSGHVGIYIGGGQIVHASSAKTGIKISNANYRSPLGVRRIF